MSTHLFAAFCAPRIRQALGIANIKEELEELGVQIHWAMISQACEYRETQ
jgi:hypothetical protein